MSEDDKKNPNRVEAAKKKWSDLSSTEKVVLEQKIAVGMRDYWKGLTLEQRSAIGRKAAESRRRNREQRLKGEKK